jgi:hypothetical protein
MGQAATRDADAGEQGAERPTYRSGTLSPTATTVDDTGGTAIGGQAMSTTRKGGLPMTGAQPDAVPDRSQRFAATVTVDRQGRTHVPVPFEPDAVWGAKPRHHVTGTVAGCGVRGVLDAADGGAVLILGPAWSRGCGPADGTTVEVALAPEGPQRTDLAPDVAAALDASPAAAAFFDSLAQFYRNAFLRWIDATKRRPEQRPLRIAEMIRLLEEGRKQR